MHVLILACRPYLVSIVLNLQNMLRQLRVRDVRNTLLWQESNFYVGTEPYPSLELLLLKKYQNTSFLLCSVTLDMCYELQTRQYDDITVSKFLRSLSVMLSSGSSTFYSAQGIPDYQHGLCTPSNCQRFMKDISFQTLWTYSTQARLSKCYGTQKCTN